MSDPAPLPTRSGPDSARISAASFDGAAERYDETFTRTRLGRLLRERVHERVQASLPEGARVLELGCGTGEDAAFLSRRGHEVWATDASEAMLRRARKKVTARGASERVRFGCLTLQELADGRTGGLPIAGEPDGEAPFDGVLADFGVLNCTNRWEDLARTLGALVRPGGRAIFVVMGRYCPGEWIWQLARRRPGPAFRRLRGTATARVGGGEELEVFYPTPTELADALAPCFRENHLEGLGALLPPTDAGAPLERNGPLLAALDRWDRILGSTRPGAWISDHYLLDLIRTEAAPPSTGPLPDLTCPRCGEPLDETPTPEVSYEENPIRICAPCDASFERRDGIWHLLTPERASSVEAFLEQYRTVREAEGRGSEDSAFYRALPSEDRTGRFAEDWAVRAQSFRTFVDRVLEPIESRTDRPLRVLDLGAGNGWLSNRIAERGHRPVALDLRVGDRDGLGAQRHYETVFPAVRADFRDLPFESGTFDLAVFNASLHYAPDLDGALQEALRVIRRNGRIAIVDSPLYRDPESGRQMMREREEAFEAEYGFQSDALGSEGFLTYARLEELTENAGLDRSLHFPSRRWRRRIAPLTARLKGDREPARLPVIVLREEEARALHGTERLLQAGRYVRRGLGRTGWRLRRALSGVKPGARPIETVAGRSIQVFPEVFNPVRLRTGRFLGESVEIHPPDPAARVLDLGCGSGVGAVVAAEHTSSVEAVDVNPAAVSCTRSNARRNEVADRVVVHEGDLFDPVEDRRYDLVLFNPPFLPGRAESPYERAWRSEGLLRRFADELPEHLRAGGHARLLLSTDADLPGILRLFWSRGFRSSVLARRSYLNETLRIYELTLDRPDRS